MIEEGTEGVRMMTAHRAKGLEFPIVILADPTCSATRTPNRYTDVEKRLWAEPLCGAAPRDLIENREIEARRDGAEAIRVAYVAATRARDMLVVPAVGDDELPGWLEVLNPAIYPQPDTKGDPEDAPGCPTFGSDSVRTRPRSAKTEDRASVSPGLHRPALGAHRVTWWDPHVLDLDRTPKAGLRHQRILEAEGDDEGRGQAAYDAWQKQRDDTVKSGEAPSIRVHAVSEFTSSVADSDLPVQVIELERKRERPTGSRFGSLVHTIFSHVDLTGDVDNLRVVVDRQVRQYGATSLEREAAYDVVQRALSHPLMRQAAEASEVRRETPVMFADDSGELVEGIVDLAFRTEEGWTVVDFKTDEDVDAQRKVYLGQIRLYVEGVTRATGERVEGILFAV
jgi:ATP-dependent exoDNAse (exonuclease V) beta subunit